MEGVEDARNLIHCYRITPDRRLVVGGSPVGLTYGRSLFGDYNVAAWQHLEKHIQCQADEPAFGKVARAAQ